MVEKKHMPTSDLGFFTFLPMWSFTRSNPGENSGGGISTSSESAVRRWIELEEHGGYGEKPGGQVGEVDIYIYTWNPNDPCFDRKRHCFGGLTFKNRGQLGSRYIYIYPRCSMFYIVVI